MGGNNFLGRLRDAWRPKAPKSHYLWSARGEKKVDSPWKLIV